MTIKRALVVDDSRSAQVALKKLLEEHDLQVDLADTGEAALEFLKKDLVDVIFMDHTMPGMDGLEAVSAIKANPRTATIPVMMYTTKEGEVYVGQARALGAVGVLPKNVGRHQLFDMLQKLDLVKERRATPRPFEEELDPELDREVTGISLQAVVKRILEDQHMTLRSDILRSQKQFARDVAAEILHEREREAVNAELEEPPEEPAPNRSGHSLLATAASTVLVIVCVLAFQFKSDRDALLVQVQQLESERVQAELKEAQGFEVSAQVHQLKLENDALRRATAQALLLGINEGNQHSIDQDAFSESLASKITILVDRLREIEFNGDVRLTSHLGRFCLQMNDSGELMLADPDTQTHDCEFGNPLANSSYISDRLSVPFAQLMRTADGLGINLELVALDLQDSREAENYPSDAQNAAQWNGVALANNRVEIELVN